MPSEQPRWKQRFADNRKIRNWNLTSLALTMPLLVIGYYYYGTHALRTAVVSVLAAVLTEFIAGRLILRRNTIDDWNAVVVGLWIACMMPAFFEPVNSAHWYAAAGSIFAILVVKIPFGGAAHTPFSPAAAGFAFLIVCFPDRAFRYAPSAIAPPMHGSSLANLLQHGGNVVDSTRLWPILLGQTVGPMGTGGILVIAVALLAMFMLKNRRSHAMASLGFIGAAALLAFVFPRVMMPEEGFAAMQRLAGVGMELFSGSMLFAAVFLLPEPSILPGRWYTRLGYGALAGGAAILLRHLGSFEETVVFAILLANAALPLMYRIQAEIRQQKEFRQIIRAEEMEVQDA